MTSRWTTIGAGAVLLAMAMAATAEDLPAGSSLGEPAPGGMARPPVVTAPEVSIAGQPALGAPEAPVTVVEFMDYECAYCQAFAKATFPALKAKYVDTGRVRWVARDFPLPRHPRSRPAAVAAACAGEQGTFWPMHDGLLANGLLRDADFAARAQELGLDAGAFEACRARAGHDTWLDAALAAGRDVGVAGTPSFLVGPTRGDTVRGRLLRGPDLASFEKALEKYLPVVDPTGPAKPAP